MTQTETTITAAATPTARHREYAMTRPEHFAVSYAINPWMDPSAAVDVELAVRQWEHLRRVYLDLGHTVQLVPPGAGLPDMVYAANGALVVDGHAYSAQFAFAERVPEGPAYAAWLESAGIPVRTATYVNEGEGDFLTVGARILAGHGFRSDPRAHAEVAELTGREVVSLRLVDPRYYHLDTALAVLGDETVAYYPGAFDDDAQRRLRDLYPDAVLATAQDAEVLGLNAVSDGKHVVMSPRATALAAQLRERGYEPIGVDLSELLKGGGGAKCCTLELRR